MALTYDGATLRLYVNGSQVATTAATGAIETNNNPLWIGGNSPYGEYFQRAHRRGPRLQPRAHPGRHPNRHEHTDRLDRATHPPLNKPRDRTIREVR